MKKWLKFLVFFVAILLLWPTNGSSTITLNSAYREIDAGIGIQYWVYPVPGDPYTETKIDDPSPINYSVPGWWNESIAAQVKSGGIIPTIYDAYASQNSNINIDLDNDVLSVSGSAKVYKESVWGFYPTYSMLRIGFTIGGENSYIYDFDITQKYTYPFPYTVLVTDGYYTQDPYGIGDFQSNSTGVIGSGDYSLYIYFYNTGSYTISIPGLPGYMTTYLSDDFSFVVQPYVAPPPTSVPEPGILILLGISMVSIAGLRIRWK